VINIFEGARRMAMLTGGLIAAGFLFAFFQIPHDAITVSYQVAGGGQPPVRVDKCETGSAKWSKQTTFKSDQDVNLIFCFSNPKVAKPSSIEDSWNKYDDAKRMQYKGVTNPPPPGFKLDTDGKHSLSIAEFRLQYPMYSDMTDSELADAIYKKFYADLPRAEFNKKIGLTPADAPTAAQPFDPDAYLATKLQIDSPSDREELEFFRRLEQERVESFKIPEADESYITRLEWIQTLKQAGQYLLGLMASLAGFWAFTWAVGWIVRGFMGIPRGSDQKPQP